MSTGELRIRRKTCYWEETYDPSLVGKLSDGSWDFAHDTGPTRRFFTAESLDTFLESGGSRVFKGVTFKECDFQGYFYHESQIVFDNCRFENCDLSLSTWENIKFSHCKFEVASFGQAIIKNCEFRSCDWHRIAISPNGTELSNTYFSNPCEFISAASTNLNTEVLQEQGVEPEVQALRLENTKATIARRILKMLQEEGGEDAYYDSVRTFLLQNATSEMASRKLRMRTASGRCEKFMLKLQLSAWWLEREVVRAFGAINRWGASVTRPVGCMVFSFFVFALIYEVWATSTISAGPLQKSFDISILAGYSSYNSEGSLFTHIAQNIQVVVSIVFYTLFFATVVNRVSRVR